MVRKQKANFLVLHYDKLLLVLAVVFLGVSVYFLLAVKGSAEGEKADYRRTLDRLKPKNEAVAPLDDTAFNEAVDAFRNAFALSSEKKLLVPEERVHCVKCFHPILQSVDICPYCNEAQPKDLDEGDDWDSDGDGMPDSWEKLHGLNPLDPSDAQGDLDDDGFTNLEEYQSKTDPSDSASHPPRYDFLRVAKIESRTFPLVFNGNKSLKRGGVYAFGIKDVTQDRDYYVVPGEQLGDTGFTLKTAESYEKEQQTSTGIRKTQYFRLTLSRGPDQIVITDERGVPQESSVFEVTFICTKDRNGETYTAKRGESFTFDNDTFKLIRIDRTREDAIVQQGSTGKEITIRKQ